MAFGPSTGAMKSMYNPDKMKARNSKGKPFGTIFIGRKKKQLPPTGTSASSSGRGPSEAASGKIFKGLKIRQM